MKTKCMLALLACSLQACSSFGSHQMFADSDAGHVMLAGDAEGIRAYNDGLSGLITNARGNPDQKSSYWQHREQETSVRGLKFRRVDKK